MKTLFFLIVVAVFFAVLYSELDAQRQMSTAQNWSTPKFKELNQALTTCNTHSANNSAECAARREERATAVVAARTCERHQDQPVCRIIRATIKAQQAEFDMLKARLPAIGSYAVEVDSFWSPENDWLDKQWTPYDRLLGLGSSLNRHFRLLMRILATGILAICIWVACKIWLAERRQKSKDQVEKMQSDAREKQHHLELAKQLREKEERQLREDMKNQEQRERAAREQKERDRRAEFEALRLAAWQKAEAQRAAVEAAAAGKLRTEIDSAITAAIVGLKKPKKR